MTVINHWCKNWFDFYPNPPIHLLNIVKKAIKREDYELHQHFKRNSYKVAQYGWPITKLLFSEIFNDDQWCIMIDVLFTYPK